ncbi:MAG: hypothetical protein EBU26_18095, partial [Verrucomicrobia bacterium]|nr:hypothetical protein [Verrucomicrobiota bacterium]
GLTAALGLAGDDDDAQSVTDAQRSKKGAQAAPKPKKAKEPEVYTKDHLTELKVIIEPIASLQPDEVPHLASELARDFQVSLALRVPVEVAQPGTLPRFEMKAKRWNRR